MSLVGELRLYWTAKVFVRFGLKVAVRRDPRNRAKARIWIRKFDDYLYPGIEVLTFAAANRRVLLQMTPEARAARLSQIPDPVRRARQQQLIERGWEAPLVVEAVRLYDKELGLLEEALGDGPYVAGPRWSLAEAAITPYINRLALIDMAPLWEEARPRVADWFARIKERPSFEAAITRFFTPSDTELRPAVTN